jgi:hypothetical protein
MFALIKFLLDEIFTPTSMVILQSLAQLQD